MDLQKGLHGREMCLGDSAATCIILQNKKYLVSLISFETKLNAILCPANLIEMFILASDTKLYIHDVFCIQLSLEKKTF